MKTVYAPSPLQGLEILSCSGDHKFAKHLHDGYVLWLNSESGEHFSVKGSSDVLQPGTISIIEPTVIHANHPSVQGKRHLRSFYFGEDFLSDLHRKISGNDSGTGLPTCVIKNRFLWTQFINLHDVLLHPVDGLSAEIYLLTTFGELFEQHITDSAVIVHSAEEWRVRTVIDYFHDNLDRQFSLDELAGLVNCTSYYLIRLFQREKNIAPHAFLIQLRLENAKALLDKKKSIADAALQSGFSDQSHLTRMFKKRYGVTPGLYQKQQHLR